MESKEKKCMMCRTEKVWLDSLFCYQCYLKETQPRPRMNYHPVNKDVEYKLKELMNTGGKANAIPPKKRKKKSSQIPKDKIFVFDKLTYKLILYTSSTRKMVVPKNSEEKFIPFINNKDKKRYLPCIVNEEKREVYINSNLYKNHAIVLNSYFL